MGADDNFKVEKVQILHEGVWKDLGIQAAFPVIEERMTLIQLLHKFLFPTHYYRSLYGFKCRCIATMKVNLKGIM